MSPKWRVGRTLKRTLYIGDHFIGTVDTPELANSIVEAMNKSLRHTIRKEAAALMSPVVLTPMTHESATEWCSTWTARIACAAPDVFNDMIANMGGALANLVNSQGVTGFVAGSGAEIPHPDASRVMKLLVQRVGGAVEMTEHDRKRADGFQLRWTDNGHTLTVAAVHDT